MWSELKDHIQITVSEAAGKPVTFRAVRFSPPFSLVLDEINISSPKTNETMVKIGTVRITPEISPIFTENVLRLNVAVTNLEAKGGYAEFIAQLDLPKKRTWKETFSSPEIETIELKQGEIAFREYRISNIIGVLALKNGNISGGDLLFNFKNEDLLLDFSRTDKEANSFYGRLRSKDYTIKGHIFPEKDMFIIENFRGSILSLNTDLKGKIEHLSKPGERYLDINGYVGGMVKDVLSMVMDKEKANGHALAEVKFTTSFETRLNENDLSGIYLVSNIKADKLSYKNIQIENISGKVSINSGLLSVSDMIFFLGPHPATIDLSMDIKKEDLPLSCTVSASGMDVSPALSGIETLKNENYGPIDLDISFSGSGKNLYSAASYFAETGKLYPDGSIFSGMEMSGRIRLERYQSPKTLFRNISTEFSLKDGNLEATKLSFDFFGGEFTGKSDISFFKQDMPVSLDISVRNIDPKFLPKDIIGKGNSVEGPIEADVSLKGSGKKISEFFTLLDQKEKNTKLPAFKKIWQTFLLPKFSSKLNDVSVDASANIAGLYLSGIKIDDASLNIIMDKGKISVPSFFFRSLDGILKGKAEISPKDKNIPLSFELFLEGIDPSVIPGDTLLPKNVSSGPIDLDIFYLGSGHLLAGMAESITGKDINPEHSLSKDLWQKALSPEYREMLSQTKLLIRTEIKNCNYNDVALKDLSLKTKLEGGTFSVPSVSLGSQGGTFSGKGYITIDYANFPLKIDALVKGMDLTEISRSILNSPGLAEGISDLAFSFSGFGRVLSETSSHIKKLERSGQHSESEKIQSTLLFLSEKQLFREQKAISSFSFKTIRAGLFKLDNIFGNLIFNEGKLSLPDLTGIFYRGIFSCNLETDLNTLGFPFIFNADIKKSDLQALIKDTLDPKTIVYGNLDLTVRSQGKAEYQSSYSGYGSMNIYDANLGRVPILTPLLGWIYESLEDIFPVFKKINIDTAGASFEIKDRKLITDDLVLAGSDICLVAEGSVDFDGKLDLSFENELIEQKIPDDADWPVSIRNFITSFGKTISRARLKGTLEDQKWEFEYLDPMKSAINNNVKAFFEGLSE